MILLTIHFINFSVLYIAG